MKTKPIISLLTITILLLFSVNSFVYGETKTEFYENGRKSMEVHLKKGIPNGSWIFWNEDGQKRRESYWNDGKSDGLATRWNDHGVKVEEINYKNGKFDGEWIAWSEDGEKIFEGNYKNDVEVGVHTRWFLNGDKRYEEHYSRGALVKHDDYIFNFVKSVVRGEEPWEAFPWQ